MKEFVDQPLLMPGLAPPITVKMGSSEPIVMTKERMQCALMYGEIPLKTYLKWALLQEYGEVTNANVDLTKIIENWSFAGHNKRKDKWVEFQLEYANILKAIAALHESEDLMLLNQPIQLKLNLYPDMGKNEATS